MPQAQTGEIVPLIPPRPKDVNIEQSCRNRTLESFKKQYIVGGDGIMPSTLPAQKIMMHGLPWPHRLAGNASSNQMKSVRTNINQYKSIRFKLHSMKKSTKSMSTKVYHQIYQINEKVYILGITIGIWTDPFAARAQLVGPRPMRHPKAVVANDMPKANRSLESENVRGTIATLHYLSKWRTQWLWCKKAQFCVSLGNSFARQRSKRVYIHPLGVDMKPDDTGCVAWLAKWSTGGRKLWEHPSKSKCPENSKLAASGGEIASRPGCFSIADQNWGHLSVLSWKNVDTQK